MPAKRRRGDIEEFEDAPETTNFQQLTDEGLELPEPDALGDNALASSCGK
jgi:hypothetical protein